MADAVTSYVFFTQTAGTRRYGIHLTGISDGTGETNVAKIVKANLKNAMGDVPGLIKICSIRWSTQGFSYVKLSTDHTTDDVLFLCMGSGYDDFEALGYLLDPNSTGGTGDLLLSSVGAANGATYDITIQLVL
jgi:hypothetical protein